MFDVGESSFLASKLKLNGSKFDWQPIRLFTCRLDPPLSFDLLHLGSNFPLAGITSVELRAESCEMRAELRAELPDESRVELADESRVESRAFGRDWEKQLSS